MNRKKISRERLIVEGNELYNNFYDYSLVPEIKNDREKFQIICPKHGIFYKNFNKHISCKQGCPACSGRKRTNTEEFKQYVKDTNNGQYSTEKVNYINVKTHVTLTCHVKDKNGIEHGDFQITPSHYKSGEGCPKCRYIKSAQSNRKSIEEKIREAKQIHGDEYDYSLVNGYINGKTNVKIICHKKDKNGVEHGVFEQNFDNHIRLKQGCPICGRIKCDDARRISFEEIVKRCKEVHPNEGYIYHEQTFNGVDDKMVITCPKHGDFTQKITNHMNLRQGFPYCKQSYGEKEIENFLKENNIKFKQQYSQQWLGIQKIDFFLTDYNIAIEIQGIQHFKPVDFAGRGKEWAAKQLKRTQMLDELKQKKCQENNVYLLYYANYKYDFPYEVITDKQNLLNKILNINGTN